MTSQFTLRCCILCSLFSVAMSSPAALRLHGNGHGGQQHRSVLVHAQKVDQKLVICNGYASPKALEIMQVRTRESLTQGKPLAYKQCKDFSLPLEEGDQLDFKSGGLDVGTFYATGLPKSAASLLLIPHRRSPHSVGISFQSHAFADIKSPQIAVIDAYRGNSDKQTAAVKIIEDMPASNDPTADKEEAMEEELNFNSVVSVNPGKYQISLTSTGGDKPTTIALNAADASKYVVMRLGVEGEGGSGGHYPQELVVFPNSASRLSVNLIAVVAVLLGLHGAL